MDTRLPFAAYLEHLRADSARFVSALDGVDPGAPVPTCPQWSAADLVAHLTEVQSFWAAVVRGRLGTDADVEAVAAPDRPESFEDQLLELRAATARLVTVLADTPPETPAWTWSAEQTVGFTYRRQALEALVHRLDAELTAGRRTGLDPALAADGVDEALRVMLGDCPPWGTITVDADPGRALRVRAHDTGSTWWVQLARFTGVDADGQAHDGPDIAVAGDDPGGPAPAQVSGAAADLLCWLWGRPPVGPIERIGEATVLADFAAIVAQPIT